MNLNWMLERAARTFSSKDAIVSAHTTISYGELLDLTQRAAAVLRDAGVTPGQRIGVMTYNTPAFIIAAFGIWRAGATLVPVNHKLTSREIGYIASHSDLEVMISEVDFADKIREACPSMQVITTNEAEAHDPAAGDFERLISAAKPWTGVPVSGEAIAQVLYTSGTTSDPKGCEHSHVGLSNVPAYTTASVGLRREDRLLIAMPIWHATLLNNWMLSMIYLGGTVVLLKEYHPVHFLQAVQDHRATAFFGAPIAYLAPLSILPTVGKEISDFDLSSMRLWIYGGAPMGPETVKTLQRAYGSDNFFQVYGMSEMGPVGTALYPAEQVTKAGAIGAGGMPGVEIRVVAEDGVDVAAGGVGEILMRSSTRMVGYLKDPGATEQAFEGEWYRTGDLARVDEDGYLFIVDRVKDVVITGGENVYSPEVEEMLLQHENISDAAIIGRPHPEWGETIIAVVVATAPLDLSEVRDFLGDRLAKYKIPRELILREELPRTPSGKIMKQVLRVELVG